MKKRRFLAALAGLAFAAALSAAAQEAPRPADDPSKVVEAMHGISSNALYEYVKELVSDK